MNTSKKLNANQILKIVIFALAIDLLAFTIILPLFPRLLQFYEAQDGLNPVYRIMNDNLDIFRIHFIFR